MTPLSLATPIAGTFEGSSWHLLRKIPADSDYPRYQVIDLARLYLSWGARFGIRADVAWAQMLLETDSLRYTGQVRRTQLNFCGLKNRDATGFASFPTLERGVIAHLAHLAAYAFPQHVRRECSPEFDPRHPDPHWNWAATVGDLSGKWAPTEDYAVNLTRRWNG